MLGKRESEESSDAQRSYPILQVTAAASIHLWSILPLKLLDLPVS